MRRKSLPEGYPEVLGSNGENLYLAGFYLTRLLMKGGERFMARGRRKGINPVMAGAAGAAIGAGIAVAATTALRSQKTRRTIARTIDVVRERASERMPGFSMDGRQLREGMKMGRKVLRATKKKTSGRRRTRTGRRATAGRA